MYPAAVAAFILRLSCSAFRASRRRVLPHTRRSYLYPGFIDAERADHVIKMAKARLAPSGLALRKGDRAEDQRCAQQRSLRITCLQAETAPVCRQHLSLLTNAASLLFCCRRNVRTSQGTFISRHEDQDGVLAWVEDKIALLSGIPAGHGEVCRLQHVPQSMAPIPTSSFAATRA